MTDLGRAPARRLFNSLQVRATHAALGSIAHGQPGDAGV